MDCRHHGKSVLLLCSSFRAPAPSTSLLCCKSRPWLFALRIDVCEQQQEYLRKARCDTNGGIAIYQLHPKG
ncbi:hypothetical protein U9M48_035057 [Paspalum notatum var. saurae]|uniref:Uncharacterized protein n=1 Tax=Paspalum notatum var. saurae TaxID=547442 RepID=A0AAQ3UB90_PASNO